MKNHNRYPISKNLVRAGAAITALTLAGSFLGPRKADAAVQQNPWAAMGKKYMFYQNPWAAMGKKYMFYQNPSSVLTGIIASLEEGKDTKVAANNIAIPGPIGEEEGKPIVFKANGQTYLAYTWDQEPNFNQKEAADVAGDMNIVLEPGVDKGMPLEFAHLDKAGILVNEDEMAVGYSTGGDNFGK